MQRTKLNRKEISDIANRIAEPTFEYMRRKINKEFNKLEKSQNSISVETNSIINILLISLGAIDINILRLIKSIYKSATNTEIDASKLMNAYMEYLFIYLSEEEKKEIMEKMN